MTRRELFKEVQNILATPYAWEKVGLGDVAVEKAAAFARDRAAHVIELVWYHMEAGLLDGSLDEEHGS